MPNLFSPIRIGNLNLPNRIIMSPLTRCRASQGRVPNTMMAECTSSALLGHNFFLQQEAFRLN